MSKKMMALIATRKCWSWLEIFSLLTDRKLRSRKENIIPTMADWNKNEKEIDRTGTSQDYYAEII
jgi:hypothetical protein